MFELRVMDILIDIRSKLVVIEDRLDDIERRAYFATAMVPVGNWSKDNLDCVKRVLQEVSGDAPNTGGEQG